MSRDDAERAFEGLLEKSEPEVEVKSQAVQVCPTCMKMAGWLHQVKGSATCLGCRTPIKTTDWRKLPKMRIRRGR